MYNFFNGLEMHIEHIGSECRVSHGRVGITHLLSLSVGRSHHTGEGGDETMLFQAGRDIAQLNYLPGHAALQLLSAEKALFTIACSPFA